MPYVRRSVKSIKSKYNHFGNRKASRAAVVTRARSRPSYINRRLYSPKGNMSLQAPFPLQKSGVVMRFVSTKILSIPVGNFAGQVTRFGFRANGIWDPDTAVGGHQPMGHDQWQVIYNHYEVTGARISVDFSVKSSEAATKGFPITYGLGIVDQNGVLRTTDEDCMMDANYRWKRSTIAEMPAHRLTHYYNPWKWNNVKGRQLPDSLTANFGNDPSEQQYFDVWASCNYGSELPNSIRVDATVCIEYTCKFSEPKQLGRST